MITKIEKMQSFIIFLCQIHLDTTMYTVCRCIAQKYKYIPRKYRAVNKCLRETKLSMCNIISIMTTCTSDDKVRFS